MVQLEGVSKTPMGVPNSGEQIRITCVTGNDEVHTGSAGILLTGSDGSYASPLLEGIFLIEVLTKGKKEWEEQGTVLVDSTVPPTVDINYLVQNHRYVLPEPVEEVSEA